MPGGFNRLRDQIALFLVSPQTRSKLKGVLQVEQRAGSEPPAAVHGAFPNSTIQVEHNEQGERRNIKIVITGGAVEVQVDHPDGSLITSGDSPRQGNFGSGQAPSGSKDCALSPPVVFDGEPYDGLQQVLFNPPRATTAKEADPEAWSNTEHYELHVRQSDQDQSLSSDSSSPESILRQADTLGFSKLLTIPSTVELDRGIIELDTRRKDRLHSNEMWTDHPVLILPAGYSNSEVGDQPDPHESGGGSQEDPNGNRSEGTSHDVAILVRGRRKPIKRTALPLDDGPKEAQHSETYDTQALETIAWLFSPSFASGSVLLSSIVGKIRANLKWRVKSCGIRAIRAWLSISTLDIYSLSLVPEPVKWLVKYPLIGGRRTDISELVKVPEGALSDHISKSVTDRAAHRHYETGKPRKSRLRFPVFPGRASKSRCQLSWEDCLAAVNSALGYLCLFDEETVPPKITARLLECFGPTGMMEIRYRPSLCLSRDVRRTFERASLAERLRLLVKLHDWARDLPSELLFTTNDVSLYWQKANLDLLSKFQEPIR